jgi:hypothetical protein
VASLVLWGEAMARSFDGRKEWRERYHLDENATHRLGKSVIRVGVSLPYIVMYALAPRESAGMTALVAGALVAAGTFGLLRMRTWGLGALGVAVLALVISLGETAHLASYGNGYALDLVALGAGGLALLAAALAPFAAPVARYLQSATR